MAKPLVHAIRYTRGKLPHWEVEHGRYFVTVRCADSLPKPVVARLSEIQLTLSAIEPQSDDFAAMQRQYFQTMEKYLDAGTGSCPLRNPDAARLVIDQLAALAEIGAQVPHYTIMPNHWRAMLMPSRDSWPGLGAAMKRAKGRTGRAIRKTIGGIGPVWQREWFDRWMRSDSEWDRCVDYIRDNPVKAGLVGRWEDHPWTH